MLRLLLRKILYKIPFFNSTLVAEDIAILEEKGDIDAARKMRKTALKNLPMKYTGPLWCSEGEDQLYSLKDYSKAQIAFEKAMKSSFTPSTNPLRIYCGASVSAVMNSEFEIAEQYYSEAIDWYNKLKDGNKLDTYLSEFDGTLQWLEDELSKQGKVANKAL